jgi:hypothetical protein
MAVLLLIAACRPAFEPLRGLLPIHAPQVIIAGSPLRVRVGPVTVSDGTGVGLVLMGKHGPYIYHATFQEGVAEFYIPAEHTRQPGTMAFIAAAEEARGEASLLLRPDPQRKTRAWASSTM